MYVYGYTYICVSLTAKQISTMKKLTKKIAAQLISSLRFTTAGRYFKHNDAIQYFGFSYDEAERMGEIFRTNTDANMTKAEAIETLVEKYNA